MSTKNKIYLILSIVVLLMTFVAIFQNFETIHFIGFETEVIWIPIWIGVVILPLLNLYEIAVNTDDYNKNYWLALIINLISIFFILRYFKIELLS
jgi:nicotinamide riboside transporter PnuC